MEIIIDNQEREIFLNKLKNLPRKVKMEGWGNKRVSEYRRIEYIKFAGKEIDEHKLTNYFNVLENRYRLALYCLEEIRKECENITNDESKISELKNKAKSNSITLEFAIKSEYFIFAIMSCLDTISHIINIIYSFGIKEKYTSFESVYQRLKLKRDSFSRYVLKDRKVWINDFREIRNRMTHHQIIHFSSNVTHELQTKKITYTKHRISIIDKDGDEVSKSLPQYFEEVINNYATFKNKFYQKLNSVI